MVAECRKLSFAPLPKRLGEHFCSSDDIAEHLLLTKTTWKIVGAFALAAAILTMLVIVLT
jgi:hypothetical protein